MAHALDVNVGAFPNDGTGDAARVAFIKINNRFAEDEALIAALDTPAAVDAKIAAAVAALIGTAPAHADTLGELYGLIQGILTLLESDEETLDTLQEIVDYIQDNRDALTVLANDKIDKTSINHSLTSIDPTEVLGADQGPVITGLIAAETAARLSMTTDDIAEGITNKYYSDTLVASAPAVVANTAKRSYPIADETKLAGIAAGATVNATDSFLIARANHTGTQAQSTIVGLVAALAAKADITSLAAVATSGDYNDLINQPPLGGDVDSVNGQTGVVVLDTDDIAEDGSPVNLWFTDARANTAILNYLDRKSHERNSTLSSTTGAEQTYFNQSRIAAHAANYRLHINFSWAYDSTTSNFTARLFVDGGLVRTFEVEPKDAGTDQIHVDDFHELLTLTAASHSYELRFQGEAVGVFAGMFNATMTLERYI